MAEDRSVSYILRALLNSLGLDEDQRQRRITCEKMNQFLYSTLSKHDPLVTPLLSGSSFEATTIHGLSSDVDVMQIINNLRIIADIKDWRDDFAPTFLMDSTECCRPFVKLYLLSNTYPGYVSAEFMPIVPTDCDTDKDGRVLLCHTVVHRGRNTADGEFHGAAFTEPENKIRPETDYVYTLRCDSFPREASGWIQRQTPLTRTRIHPSIIDDINHCYLVGVGDKNSPTEHLEWRLSFNHIENKLIHAWNSVQYQCYILMKFILKDLIKPFIPDVLCSYHFKMLIMWMNEEYPSEFFTASQLEQCALKCLHNLAETVRQRSLPHYFVQGCNLLYPKLTNNDADSKTLIVAIEAIISTWPQCLFNISRCKLGGMFRDCLTNHSLLPRVLTFVCERRRQEGYWFELLYELHGVCPHFFKRRNTLSRERTDLFCALSDFCHMANQSNFNNENKQFIDFAIKDILINVGLKWIQRVDSVSNKTALRRMRKGLRFIHQYSNSCCIDTKLQIAAHFVVTEKHFQALIFLDKIEDQIKSFTSFRCHHFDTCESYFSFRHREAVFDNRPTITEFCKFYYGKDVMYRQSNFPHVPKGLVYEMFRSTSVSPLSDPRLYYWHLKAIIHCPVYLYYLKFLSHEAQGQNAHKQVALDNMEWAAKESSEFPRTHQETNHNIIGHCHSIFGNIGRAYKEYRKSLEIEKYNNAVLWDIAVLLRNQIRGEQ